MSTAKLRTLAETLDNIQELWTQMIDPERLMRETTAEIVKELVSEVLGFDDRFLEMMQRIDSLASSAQPAVASNTGSGAAPIAPEDHTASDGSAQPPADAGTAPEQPPQQPPQA